MTHASLFSGIGGFDLAAEWAGWTNMFNCEIDSFCRRVLKYHFPNAIQYEDIKTTDFTIWRGRLVMETGKRIRNSQSLHDAFLKAAHWLVAPDRVGLKIMGGPGTGKSTLVKAMQEVINQYNMSRPFGAFGLVIQPALLIVDRCLRGDPEMSITAMIKKTALAIDDLGLEPITVKYYGTELMPIHDIVHQRINDNAPTVIVTNLDESKILKMYGLRLHDRMKDMSTIILDGISNRNNH